MRREERYKAIAIPITFVDGKPRFLTVRDRRFKEWIFVTGGCRKKEISNPLKCALRELEEETRGVVNLRSGEYTSFIFSTKNRTPEELKHDQNMGIEVIYVYHVYILFVNLTQAEQVYIIRRFNDEKATTERRKKSKLPINKTYDENDFISFDTLDEYNTRPRWPMIVDNIIKNPEFYSACNSSNRTSFNMR